MKHTIARILMTGGVATSVLFSGAATAIDWNVTGFARQEIAYSVAGNNNELNKSGLVFNDRVVPHYTNFNYGTPGANFSALTTFHTNASTGRPGLFALLNGFASPSDPVIPGINGVPAGANTSSPVNCRFGHLNAINAGATGFFGTGTFRGVACPGPTGAFSQGTYVNVDNPTGGGAFNVVPGVNPGVNPGGVFLAQGTALGSSIPPALTSPVGFGPGAATFSPQGNSLNDDINFNLFNTRVEVDVQARFNKNWAAYVKFRGYFDGSSSMTDAQISDHYKNPFWGTSGQLAEWNSPNFALDLPAAYVDYNNGPLWIRVGNQTIAWGEAYFFRVMDVANGLDLRRHLTLGPGGEEYSDQRVASPAIRVSYTFNNGWELDAFAQMWSPTILPAINTPYSVIGAGVTLDERDEFDDAEGSINFGARLTMNLTDYLTGIVLYTNRRSPDGVARFAEAPNSNAGLENRFCVGAFNDTNNLVKAFAPALGLTVDPATGAANMAPFGLPNMPALQPGTKNLNNCGSPLAPDPLAANSTEFFHLAGRARLDPIKTIRVVVDEWPADQWATREIFGFGQELNVVDTLRTAEGFHSSFGGFRAWATREFKREHIIALGANYLINADPDSIFDQLLVRGEVSVTPNKKFTDLGLSFKFIEETEVVSAFILEKYHRFTPAFPATYIVLQWMHRTSSDLFGRHLSGTETTDLEDFIDPVTGGFLPAAFVPGAAAPKGSDNADYVVFAIQQPFPNLVWRFDLALLIDVEGAYLIQPGLRYRPAANWQWDLYANLIEEGGDENDDIMETIDFADEVFVRLTYYF